MADDYISFISDIKKWVYKSIKFINFTESKYYNYFSGWDKFGEYPIGVFEDSDIEIHFLHYNSQEKALIDWNRRVMRINWNKILIKFNDQNGCSEEHIIAFEKLDFKNKVCFTVKEYSQYKSIIKIKTPKNHEFIRASYEPFGSSKFININDMLNNI